MRFDELMKYAEQEGFKAGQEIGRQIGQQVGQQIGQNRILSLVDHMLADGKEIMLSKLQDSAVLEEMLNIIPQI